MNRMVWHLALLSGVLILAVLALGCTAVPPAKMVADEIEEQFMAKGQELEATLVRIHKALMASGERTREQLSELYDSLVATYERDHRPSKLVFFPEDKTPAPVTPTPDRPDVTPDPDVPEVPTERIDRNIVSRATLTRRGMQVIWRLELDGTGIHSAYLDDGQLYLVTNGNRIYCIDQRSGITRWVYTLDRRLDTKIGFSPDYVVFSSFDTIHVLNKTDGTERWRFETDIQPASEPYCDDTWFIFGAWNGDVHGFRFGDRHPHWTYRAGNRVFVRPDQHEGMVYAAADEGNLAVYNAERRLLHGSFDLGGRPAGIAGTDNMLYVGNENFEVTAIHRASLNRRWSFGAGGRVTDGPWLSDDEDVLYFSAFRDGLYSVSAVEGDERWFLRGGLKPVARSGNNLLVLREAEQVAMVDDDTGQVQWSEPIAPFVGVVTNQDNDVISLYTADGRVYAVAFEN